MRITEKELRRMIREAYRDTRSRLQMLQDLGDPPGPARPRLVPPEEGSPEIQDLGMMIRKKPILMKRMLDRHMSSKPGDPSVEAGKIKQMIAIKKKLEKDVEDARSALEMDLVDPYTLNRIEKGAEGLALISAIALKDLDMMPEELQQMGVLKLFEVRDELESVLTVLREQGRGDGVAVNLQELDSAAYNMMDLLRSIADSIDPSTIDPDLYWTLQSVEEGSWWGLK